MSDTIKVRPVWVSVGATREDEQCAMRKPVHGSHIQFTRCLRDRDTERNGWPLCRGCANRLEAS